nr:SprT family zinc-dependent metalloprotease [Pacificimonas pallii]
MPNPRARRITLRADPRLGRITVSHPRHLRRAKAERFLAEKHAWITAQLETWPAPQPFQDGGTLPFEGEDISIRHDVTARRMPALSGAVLTVGGPADMISGRVERWLRTEARARLTEDSRACAAQLEPGAAISRITSVRVRDTASRWGSCNPHRGTINYSWRLILAPPLVRRAVVAHEVAHLVHAGHGPEFHALADRLAGGTQRESDIWLRAHGADLHRVGRQ